MNRRKFIGVAGGTIAAVGTAGYLLSDKSNLCRANIKPENANKRFQPNEEAILFLASLAPSGHNTQPWFVEYLEPYHYVIGSDREKWLPAVDPTQRETMLSIGAFVQNLEYAAGSFGYRCQWKLLAKTNQDERVMEIKLTKGETTAFDVEKIKGRRTVRAPFLTDALRKEDVKFLVGDEAQWLHYLPATSKEGQTISEQTIEANRLQAFRDPAERELAHWIRFSSASANQHRDGLTTAGMEIEGISGWIVRNFYGENHVMQSGFRNQSVRSVIRQVGASAGWIVITSNDNSPATLLETGKRMQRLFLQVRDKSIALHPMTQILEEASTKQAIQQSLGINDPIQFLLRTGYLNDYPAPVSLRRPVDWFVRT